VRVEECRIQLEGGVAFHTFVHVDASGAQTLRAAACDATRIANRDHDTCDACRDERVDAGRRLAIVCARLKRDVDRGTASALTRPDVAVPKDRSLAEIGAPGDVPATYVPARNTVLLSLALAWAETLGARDLFVGVNVLDASGYPDCRPEFVRAFEALAQVATRAGGFHVHAPLIELTKAQIIRLGLSLGVDYALTHSCYDPVGGLACGRCDACALRRKGFAEAGVADPTRYAVSS